jgi:DNA-binding transcriptional regulator YiaG
MKKEQCNNCGNKTSVTTGDYAFYEIGLPLMLRNVDLLKCEACETVDPIIPDMNGLMHAAAFAVVSRPCKLHGYEIRFLRKYVGMSGREFSKLLDIDPTTLSKWENDSDGIGAQSDRLVRLLVTTMSKELRPKSEELVNALWEITDCYSKSDQVLQIDPETLEYEYA